MLSTDTPERFFSLCTEYGDRPLTSSRRLARFVFRLSKNFEKIRNPAMPLQAKLRDEEAIILPNP